MIFFISMGRSGRFLWNKSSKKDFVGLLLLVFVFWMMSLLKYNFIICFCVLRFGKLILMDLFMWLRIVLFKFFGRFVVKIKVMLWFILLVWYNSVLSVV